MSRQPSTFEPAARLAPPPPQQNVLGGMALRKEHLELLLSLVFSSFAVWSLVYMSCFLINLEVPYLVPTTVDSRNSHQLLASPLWNNLLLLLGFGFQHSGMQRGPLRYLTSKLFSDGNCRLVYMWASGAYLTCILYFWAPMTYTLWDVQQQWYLKLLVNALEVLSGIGLAISLVALDPLELFGISTPLNKVLRRSSEGQTLVTTGIYGQMRHPCYTFVILRFWITPCMTLGHLLFSVIFTGYILIAVAHFEEPDLVRVIGPDYVAYAKKTPRYIPHLFGSSAKKNL